MTAGATRILKGMFDRMERAPFQLFRLRSDPAGSLKLELDSLRQTDQMMRLEGTPVLLIETPLPSALAGATLDIRVYAQGNELVISH